MLKEAKTPDPRSSDAINQHDGEFWLLEGEPWSLDGQDRHKVLPYYNDTAPPGVVDGIVGRLLGDQHHVSGGARGRRRRNAAPRERLKQPGLSVGGMLSSSPLPSKRCGCGCTVRRLASGVRGQRVVDGHGGCAVIFK